MKKILPVCLLFALLIAILPVFSSCNDQDAVTLYVYNWGEYISDGSEGSLDTNRAFEE